MRRPPGSKDLSKHLGHDPRGGCSWAAAQGRGVLRLALWDQIHQASQALTGSGGALFRVGCCASTTFLQVRCTRELAGDLSKVNL